MAINVWEYLDEYQRERSDILALVDKVFSSGRVVLGSNVSAFESEFSAYCGAGYGVGVNSATDALFLGLKALGISAGDEVITVSNTAVPTVSAITSAGAIPRFVDIDPHTLLMDVTKLEAAVTKKTRCIVPVHLFGQCVNMDVVNAVAKKHGLFVMEDCAQAHGACFKGKKAGSMSDLSAFSFYPTKLLGTYGDGGLVMTNDEKLAAKLKRLRFYGMETQYYSLEQGYNSRLDEVHAAILRYKLERLDGYIAKRRALAARYDSLLANTTIGLPKVAEHNFHAYYIYVCRHPERDRLLKQLKEQDINLNISYPWPIHTMPAFTHLGYHEGDFPETEKAAKEIFSIPMYPDLGNDKQDRFVEVLLKLL